MEHKKDVVALIKWLEDLPSKAVFVTASFRQLLEQLRFYGEFCHWLGKTFRDNEALAPLSKMMQKFVVLEELLDRNKHFTHAEQKQFFSLCTELEKEKERLLLLIEEKEEAFIEATSTTKSVPSLPKRVKRDVIQRKATLKEQQRLGKDEEETKALGLVAEELRRELESKKIEVEFAQKEVESTKRQLEDSKKEMTDRLKHLETLKLSFQLESHRLQEELGERENELVQKEHVFQERIKSLENQLSQIEEKTKSEKQEKQALIEDLKEWQAKAEEASHQQQEGQNAREVIEKLQRENEAIKAQMHTQKVESTQKDDALLSLKNKNRQIAAELQRTIAEADLLRETEKIRARKVEKTTSEPSGKEVEVLKQEKARLEKEIEGLKKEETATKKALVESEKKVEELEKSLQELEKKARELEEAPQEISEADFYEQLSSLRQENAVLAAENEALMETQKRAIMMMTFLQSNPETEEQFAQFLQESLGNAHKEETEAA